MGVQSNRHLHIRFFVFATGFTVDVKDFNCSQAQCFRFTRARRHRQTVGGEMVHRVSPTIFGDGYALRKDQRARVGAANTRSGEPQRVTVSNLAIRAS